MRVLKFGAVWCPSCLIMRPMWNEIEKEYPTLKTEYYDYDMNNEEVVQWNVGKILPVAILLNNQDEEVARFIGEKTKKELLGAIENLTKEE